MLRWAKRLEIGLRPELLALALATLLAALGHGGYLLKNRSYTAKPIRYSHSVVVDDKPDR
jgi:hypothetical protein